MLFLDELDQALKRVAKTLQKVIGRGMVAVQFRQHLARLPAWDRLRLAMRLNSAWFRCRSA